ncbi:MAG: response regulator [Desulfobacterales bacterium]
MRVLLIDDEEEFVATLAERLRLRGIAADWTTSAEAGLRRAAETTYDIAVLDVKMPGVSGIDLKSRIQALSPETKYIFLTGHGSEKDFIAGKSISEFYLIKPVQIDDLVEKLQIATGQTGAQS